MEIADKGTTNWRTVDCPRCGSAVTWTVATKYNDTVTCKGTIGDRGKGQDCKFTAKRADWDYIREKGPEAGQRLLKMVDDERKRKEGERELRRRARERD